MATPPGPKQLFSSFQKATSVEQGKATPPLREAGLPPGINTTKIVAVQSSNLVEKTQQATLGEVFPVPSQSPSSSASEATQSTRPQDLLLSDGTSLLRSNHSLKLWDILKLSSPADNGWTTANASPPQSSKRRQRDRAMSLGGAKAPAPEVNAAESEAAKQEALFRSAYSSFAPTKDDSAAVAPTSVLERMWWQQKWGAPFRTPGRECD